MRRLIIALALALCGFAALAQELDREAVASAEVNRYVDDWTKNLPPKFRMRAYKHIASVAHWSVYYDVDPLLVAVMISLESSWDVNAVGKIGEIGLLQVHARGAKTKFDLSKGDEQIQAGVKWLRTCIDTCGGDTEKGVNMYATGSCSKKWRGLKYRMKLYRKAVEKFRVENGADNN